MRDWESLGLALKMHSCFLARCKKVTRRSKSSNYFTIQRYSTYRIHRYFDLYSLCREETGDLRPHQLTTIGYRILDLLGDY